MNIYCARFEKCSGKLDISHSFIPCTRCKILKQALYFTRLCVYLRYSRIYTALALKKKKQASFFSLVCVYICTITQNYDNNLWIRKRISNCPKMRAGN